MLLSRLAGFTLGAVLSALPMNGQQAIDESREMLTKYVETKKLIAETSNEWEAEKEIIQATVDTLKRQIDDIRLRIEEAKKLTTEDEAKRKELQEKLLELSKMTATFEPSVVAFESKMRTLLPYLPDPLMAKVRRLVDQLPKEGERGNPRLLNNRAVIVIGILEEIDNFQNSIPVHQELLDVGGSKKEFSVIYLGLAGAYFVDDTATIAGVGRPTDKGWVWEAKPELAEDIFAAVQIREKKLLARFVDLPVAISAK